MAEIVVTPDAAGSDSDGGLAQPFLADVGRRIRARRRERSLTVQQLADMAAISRRLLTQVELGQANPTLVTVTRIARQLGVDFTELLSGPPSDSPVEVTMPDDHVLVWSSPAGSTAHLLVATAGPRSADLWRWSLVPGDVYHGRADPVLSQELFYVLHGELTLRADAKELTITSGASGRLRSDRPYTYANRGDVPATFVRTVALSP